MYDWTFEAAGRLADDLCEHYSLDPIEDLVAVGVDIWSGHLNLHTEGPLPGVQYVEAARGGGVIHYRSTFEHDGERVETVYLAPIEQEGAA